MALANKTPELRAVFDGLPATERMKAFGIIGMVSYPHGWEVTTAEGRVIAVPSHVGHWFANLG